MIPFGCLSAWLLPGEGSEIEVSVQDLSCLGFTFRLPSQQVIPELEGIRLHFRTLSDPDARFVLSRDTFTFFQDPEESSKWHTVYRVETNSPGFAGAARAFMRDYSDYVRLKTAGDFDCLARDRLPAWQKPMDSAEDFSTGLSVLRTMLRKKSTPGEWNFGVPVLLCVQSSWAVRTFLKHDFPAFLDLYRERLSCSHPLLNDISGVVLGSSFCPLRFPDTEVLIALIRQAQRQNLQVMLELPPVPARLFERFSDMLRVLKEQKLDGTELLVNDWGMPLQIPQISAQFSLSLGRLMLRPRKDPRMLLWASRYPEAGNPIELLTPWGTESLKEMSIQAVSLECHGQPVLPPSFPYNLFLPFYQTNTASLCTLRAFHETGDRGRQKPADTCAQYCENSVFAYPNEPGLIGIGNTLFGFDSQAFTNPAWVREHLSDTCRNIILDLLA